MGINVKTKVNFNEIIEKLHRVAKDFAEQKSGKKIELDNIAFDDSKGKFLGGGEFCIFMKQKEGIVTEKDKGRFFEVIKEYVHYFVGEEEVKYIEEDSLQPIYLDSTAGQEEVEEIKKKKEDEEKEKEQKNQQSGSTPQQKNESIYYNNKLLNILFEENEQDKTVEKNTEDTDKENDDNSKCIGYGVVYSIDVNGNTDWTITKAISNKSKGLFGGIAADLLNIKIKIGGEPVNLGHVLDPKKWMEKLGMKDIDASQVAGDAKKAFDNDFKHNKAEISVEDNEYLESVLNRDKKSSPEILGKMKNSKYSLLIQVNSDDPWYPKYNTDSIAKTISKALGTTYNAGIDWNSVSKKDVIKIDNTERIKPQKKEWDPNKALDDLLRHHEKQNNNDEKDYGNKKSIKESEEQTQKEDTSAEEEKQTLKDVIIENLDKNSKTVYGENLIDSGYQKIEEFQNNTFVKGIKDDKIVENLKERYKEVLYIIVKEKEQNVIKESEYLNSRTKILDMLFESEKSNIDKVTKIFKDTFVETGKTLGLDYKNAERFKVWETEIRDISNESLIIEKSKDFYREKMKNKKPHDNTNIEQDTDKQEQSKEEKNKMIKKLYVVGSIFEENNGDKKQTQSNEKDKRVVDWYIIPHRGIKDKGQRNMQHSTDSHGVTTTSTSDKEYKPKGK